MELSQAERLAALLDGKCTPQEREELLAQLAAGGADLEVFADAAALLHDQEEEERAGVIPLAPPVTAPPVQPRRKPPRWVPLAVAAGVAALLLVPLLRQLRRGERVEGPAAFLEQLRESPAALTPAAARVEWTETRGNGACEGLERSKCAVRLGVKLVQLEIVSRTGPAGSDTLAADVADLLDGVAPSSEVAERYRAISGPPVPPELGPRAEKAGGAATRLGEWVQTARVAAEQQDWAFFGKDTSREVLEGKGEFRELLEPARGELRQVGAAADGHDGAALRAALDRLLALLAD